MPPVEMSSCTNPGVSTGTVVGVGIGPYRGISTPSYFNPHPFITSDLQPIMSVTRLDRRMVCDHFGLYLYEATVLQRYVFVTFLRVGLDGCV